MPQIAFNQIARFGDELDYLQQALESGRLAGDGTFTRLAQQHLSQMLSGKPTLLTPSCTAALEMCAILLNIGPGDEVIMPSYTFVSTANAFVLRGARIRFVDVRPDTMNIDERQIAMAINERTRAIVVVHYAGVGCEMNTIAEIANKYQLPVVEDAAQGLQAAYQDSSLGTFGCLATFSFHESKNLTSGGEGGLLAVNDPNLVERAEIIREKGTNRSRFMRREVNKYSWLDVGSSQLAGELQAAHLYSQLQHANEIYAKRMALWEAYYERLVHLQPEHLELPVIPPDCRHNAHMFYIKCVDTRVRSELMSHLQDRGIPTAFHYVPLHSSAAGVRHGDFSGEDIVTTTHSERLLRLPLHYHLELRDVELITAEIAGWFGKWGGTKH